MTDASHQPSLTIRVIWHDDDLIELISRLTCGDWRCVAQAYASASELAMRAAALSRWTNLCEGEFVIQNSTDGRNGVVMLRFRTIDMAGHAVCLVTLADGDWLTGHPSMVPRRMAVEFRTEPGLIERFAKQLATLGAAHAGEATLHGVC